jgi:hypothetical protein
LFAKVETVSIHTSQDAVGEVSAGCLLLRCEYLFPSVLATQITSLKILKSELCGLGDEPRVYLDVSTRLDKLYEESEINVLLEPITHQGLWVEKPCP